MISRTKYTLDEASIQNLFEQAGISGVTSVAPLGDGEFNAVYLVHAGGRDYVLKVAPRDSAPVMAYEHNMMQSEVAWYDVLRQHTAIRVPEVYAADFSRRLLPVPYFIMEYMPGEPLNKAALSTEERAQVDRMLPAMAAQLHAIRSDRFGYLQNGLFGTWYDAIRAFVCQALDDCGWKKRRSRRGERLLKLIERHRAVLEPVEGCMVNFDIWPANILVQRGESGIQLG